MSPVSIGTRVKRVLVADNDRHLIGELETALRSAPGEWDVVCVMSSRDALDQLARSAFDAAVVGAEAPGIDGLALLEEVARRQPGAVRFLLSTRPDVQWLLRAGETVHQHLVKPLQAQDLFTRLARTLALGDVLSDPPLQALVSRLKSVPSPPAAYMAILAEMRKEEASGRKVGELVARDAGMAAKILQLVNSPFFGLRMGLADPVQAVQDLGLETVRALVLTAHVFEQVDLKTVARFQLSRVWRHSLAAAGCARVVAQLENAPPDGAGEAFTGALLHDIGKLVLARSLPDDYADVLSEADADQVPTWMAERDMLGTTHAEIGAYLLSLWGLPEAIVEAVAWHHQPSGNPAAAFGPLVVVHVADVIEHRLRPVDRTGVPSPADEDYLDRLHLAGRLGAWSAGCQGCLAA